MSITALAGGIYVVPADEQPTHEVGAIAVGYNVMIFESIELINEISCDVPRGDEQISWGVSTGIIVTMP